ncbi:carboxypeptidase-like regulatory domain-containing protein [Aegicerativicinus sediminis]|uniref:carboxypeptidase-like regulatory domain-containing protein n=1 Tax=Aegicerativicinus sediminis TaxID=2893202 RepID=UPI001E62580D|nr:carboxypeptidase-like regulatory domain-containing protein [Aegicerativicinus sediminis]
MPQLFNNSRVSSFLNLTLTFLIANLAFAQTVVLDSVTKQPVSYATISFGNGQGIFADDKGKFIFTKKLYPDVDSLFVTALGFKDLSIATENLPETLLLVSAPDELETVELFFRADQKFDEETTKPITDNDYFNCWLPTIESEIAVYFPKKNEEKTRISKVIFPITPESKDWDKRKRSNSEKHSFSTLFKIKFYENEGEKPGKPLSYDTYVVRTTEKDGDQFTLDISDRPLLIPEDGVYISIQVLGYTDKDGNLLPNKKYKEIKTGGTVVKIPTNFRPLLPFTDKWSANRTFIKRVFISNSEWTSFQPGTGIQSSLLKKGLNNYGIGVTYRIYE